MTLDEAIKRCKEEAEKYMEYGIETECYQCGKEHEQLAEWLTELADLKEEIEYCSGDINERITEFATFSDVQPVNQWINVNERLPDESCECLGVVDGEVTEVSYNPKQKGLICVWSMCDADGFKPLSDDAVTHWQPLPKPPVNN